MAFAVAQRINPISLAYRATHPSGQRRRSAVRATRAAMGRLRSRLDLTPQERAVLFVSRMPVAVLGADLRL
jgi:hypothetical protein